MAGQAVKPGFVAFLSVLMVAASPASPAGARALDTSNKLPSGSFMPQGPDIEPPYGFVDLCLRDRKDCEGGTDTPARMALTTARWTDVNAVNAMVNRLPQVTDKDNYQVTEYWTYPDARGGDCEDLALEKRRILIEHGWPASSLLLATVMRPNGEGHAVLLIETDRGEFVLDNVTSKILSWADTPYTWRKRQSPLRPYAWSSLDPSKPRTMEAKLPPLGAPAPFFGSTEKTDSKSAGN